MDICSSCSFILGLLTLYLSHGYNISSSTTISLEVTTKAETSEHTIDPISPEESFVFRNELPW